MNRNLSRGIGSQPLARTIGVGRVLAGGGFLLAPVAATRMLGLDTATAKRVGFLSRMMAARDVAIGAGTAVAGNDRRVARVWLLAGAAADATDAVVIGAALRNGRARGPVAAAVVGVAGAAAAVAAVGALLPFRRRG